MILKREVKVMKIGTIGTGFIVDRFLEAVSETDSVQCVAVYSRTLDKAKTMADKWNVKTTYDSIDTMLADTNIDTIYVASPNSLHFEQSLKALRAGKHVICEKPFTSTVAELDQLIETAKAQNVMLWEAITNIYTPNLNIVKDTLNEIGNIRMVTCNFSQFSSRYPAYLKGENPNVFNPEFSGGSLMDINLYNVHLTMHLFGKPLSYVYYPNIAANGIDTSGTMIMKYDGFIATLIGAKDSVSDNYACIQGDEGTIVIDGASTGVCKHATLTKIKQKPELISIEQNQHMTYELRAFQKMLEENDFASCHEKLAYSKEVLTVIETARKEAGIYFRADH